MPAVPPPQASPSAGASASAPARLEPSPPSPGGGYEESAQWPLWFAPGAIALGFGLGIIATIFVDVLGRAGGGSLSHPTAAQSLAGDIVFDLAFVAAALYFAGLRGRRRPEDFGFRLVRIRRAIGGLVAAGVSYYAVTDVYASLLSLHGTDKLPGA